MKLQEDISLLWLGGANIHKSKGQSVIFIIRGCLMKFNLSVKSNQIM